MALLSVLLYICIKQIIMADNKTKKTGFQFLTIKPIEDLPQLEGEPLISPEERQELLQKLDELSKKYGNRQVAIKKLMQQ